jgi:hypothetical protein
MEVHRNGQVDPSANRRFADAARNCWRSDRIGCVLLLCMSPLMGRTDLLRRKERTFCFQPSAGMARASRSAAKYTAKALKTI